MTANYLQMWTIYRITLGASPVGVVARKFCITPGAPVPTGDVLRFASLDVAREYFIEMGLVAMARDPTDDPSIVETWV